MNAFEPLTLPPSPESQDPVWIASGASWLFKTGGQGQGRTALARG
jgi:hypothetical protein